MLVNDTYKRIKPIRTEAKKMHEAGYKRIEGDWRIHRGGNWNGEWRILDAKVSCDGKYIYVKTNIPTGD